MASGENVIAVLQKIQEAFGYISEETVHWFAQRSGVPESKLFGVATFYAQFRLSPRGKNIITTCCGTVCHVKGAPRILSRLRDELKLKDGEATTKDGLFTLEKVACLGACSMAPVLVINKKVHARMNPDKAVKSLKPYKGESRE